MAGGWRESWDSLDADRALYQDSEIRAIKALGSAGGGGAGSVGVISGGISTVARNMVTVDYLSQSPAYHAYLSGETFFAPAPALAAPAPLAVPARSAPAVSGESILGLAVLLWLGKKLFLG